MSVGADSSTLTAAGEPLERQRPDTRAYLFLVLHSHEPLVPPARICLQDIDEVVIGRGAQRAFELVVGGGVRRVTVSLPDPWLSSTHARIGRLLGRHLLEDGLPERPSRNGTFVNGERCSRAELSDGDLVEVGRSFFLFREGLAGEEEKTPIFDTAGPAASAHGLASLLPSLRGLFGGIERVARSDISVIIEGETGTGKEVLARAIHSLSGRPGGFVAVNCGALPRDLIEAELFGHRRGAFSGATEDRPGLLKSADGGTLLLDEVGDMPLPAQAVLLRALQEREVRPVGATRPVAVDLRVVAATHKDLDAMVAAGQFRSDLLARLAGHRVELPPLRARREDIGMVLASILRRVRAGGGVDVKLEPAAARLLLSHDWPGNVRELEKVVTTALVLAPDGSVVSASHLPESVQRAGKGAAASREVDDARRKSQLTALLREHRGNLSAIARAMGKARVQVQRWMKRFQLDAESFRQ